MLHGELLGEDAIRERGEIFRTFWSSHLRHHPLLPLTPSLNGLGVYDLILSPLRFRDNLTPSEFDVVRGVACCIGALLTDTWRAIGCQVQLQGGDDGVEIRVISGPEISPKSPTLCRVEKILLEILAKPPASFAAFGDFQKFSGPDANLVSNAFRTMVFGGSSLLEGSWRELPMERIEGDIAQIEKRVARVSLHQYEQAFPSERTGQIGELYLQGALFPPLSYREAFIGERALTTIKSLADDFRLKPEALRVLGANWALCADNQLSDLGVILGMALSDHDVPEAIQFSLRSRAVEAGVLRESIVQARNIFRGHSRDYLFAPEYRTGDDTLFLQECRVGLLPLFYPDADYMKVKKEAPRVTEFFAALLTFDLKAAVLILESIVEEKPTLIPLRLQQIALEILMGEFDQADTHCRSLLTEPKLDQDPRVQTLWAICSLRRGAIDEAATRFDRAYRNSVASMVHFPALCNDYGWMLFHRGEPKEALRILNESLRVDPCSLNAQLNRISVMRASSGDREAAEQQLMALALKYPTLRMLFYSAFLVSNGAS